MSTMMYKITFMRKIILICKNFSCDTIFGKSGDYSSTYKKRKHRFEEAQVFLCPLLVTLIPSTRSHLVK